MAVRTSLMEFQIPRIVHEEVDDNRGVFQIEPLDRGFGYTFGNSLRRVLLSSLEGAAVTSVKIEGVAHEFTTLPGVREDVTDVLIRQLAIFTDLEKIEGFGEAAAVTDGGATPEPALAHGMENFPIEELELGVRSYNCLKRVGIETIGDLVVKTENELAAIPNFGKKSIEEVKETLGTHGLTLRGENGGGGAA